MSFILGAGFTGLAAGIKTGLPIYEQTGHAGGICRSYKRDRYEFSTGGGHWIFGQGAGLEYIKSQVSLQEYERRAAIYYHHTIPYPFQTTAKAPCMANERSLKHWLINEFGPEQFNLFFGPFNEKYTAGLYDKIIQTDEYKSPKPGGSGFCAKFYDPVGGLSTLVDKMASQCVINYKNKATKIDVAQKRVYFEEGFFMPYEKLISTIPLNQCMRLCGLEKNLPYTSVLVINIGAKPGRNCPNEHWMYIPFCRNNFYRVGFYSNIDKSKAPEGKVSLSVEMAYKPDEQLDLKKTSKDVINELQSWGWIDQVDVVEPTWVPCAYTWLYNRSDAQWCIDWLRNHNIISIGRYGKWKFQGMTQSIEDGLDVKV